MLRAAAIAAPSGAADTDGSPGANLHSQTVPELPAITRESRAATRCIASERV
jgi:hypothetical protein